MFHAALLFALASASGAVAGPQETPTPPPPGSSAAVPAEGSWSGGFETYLYLPEDDHFLLPIFRAAPRPEIREVLFLDTADFGLYNNAFILRRRIRYEDGFPSGDPEIVFKFRHPDMPQRRRPGCLLAKAEPDWTWPDIPEGMRRSG